MSKDPASSPRSQKMDNVKGGLILLVVLGHFIDEYTSRSAGARSLFLFIYTFHMPLFIFVSGLFCKRTVREKRYDKIAPFFVLYVFLKLLRSLADLIDTGKFSFNFLKTSSSPWFCLAIFFFYLITIAVRNANKGYVLAASVILACLVGYDSEVKDFLVLSRTIVFYPFFFLGYCLEPKDLERVLSNKWLRLGSLAAILLFAAFVFLKTEDIYWLRPLLTGRNPFRALDKHQNAGGLIRFAYYFAAGAVCFCFMAIIPQKSRILSYLGKRSLEIYAFHRPLMIVFYAWGLQDLMEKITPVHYVWLTIPLALLLSFFCSLKIFALPLDFIRQNGRSENK